MFTVLVLLKVLPILTHFVSWWLPLKTDLFAFCGTTHLDTKPWPAKRVENKAAKSHVAQKKVFECF